METINYRIDDDGIAILSIDIAHQPVNVLSAAFRRDLREAVERVAADGAVRGAILTSAKSTFIAGADLKDPEFARTLSGHDDRTPAARLAHMRSFGDTLRRLETCGKPFAVAINGSALGGGFEICLACHYRVIVDAPGVKVGLPEVTLGLMPAAGGTQRVPRLLGIATALPLLVQGKALSVQDAVAIGLVHQAAPADRLIETCRAWIRDNPGAVQPWDHADFAVPGGTGANTAAVAEALLTTTRQLEKTTHGNYPAPLAIVAAVDAGTQTGMDAGLDIEIRHALALWSRPGAGNMMRTLFINKSWLDKLPKRPIQIARQPLTRIGIVGAGVMGAGIAQAAAKAGIAVVLLDRDLEAAARGKAACARSLARAVEKQATTRDAADALLTRIVPTDRYADFSDCAMVIEAVFESRDIKAEVIAAAEAVLPAAAIVASNTSTLPITSLAAHSGRPDRFIGMHFFSPVDRMPLVEVIRGKATSDATLAIALDLVAALRKTPIVVNDGRGFFTSRCFGAMSNEAAALLEAGIDPLLIERAALAAGMPVAPLTLADIMGADLSLRVDDQARSDLGAAYVETAGIRVRRTLALAHGRKGKAAGGGFYDYEADGSRRIWPGLAAIWPLATDQPAFDDVKQAMLFSQSLEAVRALDEGVLNDPVEGDVGSVIGWGFPAYTGGVFSLIDTHGAAHFAAECERLAHLFGPRFRSPSGLVAKAQANAAFVEARL